MHHIQPDSAYFSYYILYGKTMWVGLVIASSELSDGWTNLTLETVKVQRDACKLVLCVMWSWPAGRIVKIFTGMTVLCLTVGVEKDHRHSNKPTHMHTLHRSCSINNSGGCTQTDFRGARFRLIQDNLSLSDEKEATERWVLWKYH